MTDTKWYTIEDLYTIEKYKIKHNDFIFDSNEEKSFESHAWITFDNKIVLNNDLKVNSYKIIHTI